MGTPKLSPSVLDLACPRFSMRTHSVLPARQEHSAAGSAMAAATVTLAGGRPGVAVTAAT